jgi:ribosome-associated protein
VADHADDLVVDARITIRGHDLQERFTTSGGPGGQHANRSHTRVELTLDLRRCSGLRAADRQRLVERHGDRIVVVAAEERSQARNRQLARRRLAATIRNGLARRRPRRATRPTAASQTRRLDAKRRRGRQKQDRRRPGSDD